MDDYEAFTGLRASPQKSKAMWIGSAVGQPPICQDLNFTWCHTIKFLGVILDDSLKKMDVNFEQKFEEAERLLASWKKRSLTILGRIAVWKTLVLSKFTYVALMTPIISQEKIKRLKDLMLNYIWNGSTPRIALKTMEKPVREGGLNLTNLEEYFNGLKSSWVRRLYNSSSPWKTLLVHQLQEQNVDYELLYVFGNEYSKVIGEAVTNPFWQEAFRSFACWSLMAHRLGNPMDSPVWYNSDIVRGYESSDTTNKRKKLRANSVPKLLKLIDGL